MIHSHSDREIKTCALCQENLQEIGEGVEKLDRTGVWTFHKKAMRKGGLVLEWNPSK